jgi:hypothetical protein
MIAAVFLGVAFGQDPSPVITLSREAIKEGRSSAHEKVEADWANAFRRAKYPYYYLGMTPMNGTSEVWFISMYQSFADIEKSDNMMDHLPLKNESDMLEARDGELRSGSSNEILVYRPDLSFHPTELPLGKYRYAVDTIYRVRLGHMQEFLDGSKLFLAAMAKSGSPYPSQVYEVVGGHQGVFHIFTPLEALAPIDSMSTVETKMAEAMGPETMAKAIKSEGDIFESVDTTFFRINPKMSYIPAEAEALAPDYWRPKPAPAKK